MQIGMNQNNYPFIFDENILKDFLYSLLESIALILWLNNCWWTILKILFKRLSYKQLIKKGLLSGLFFLAIINSKCYTSKWIKR